MFAVVVIAICTVLLAQGVGSRADEPRKEASPSELFAKVVEAAKIPDSAGENVRKSRENIKSWEEMLKTKTNVDPVLVVYTARYITPTVVEKALGKPDRKTEAAIPGLLTQQGEKIKGPVYWYGTTGFNFGKSKIDGKEDEYLLVIRHEAK
jgi:hypothetical protein